MRLAIDHRVESDRYVMYLTGGGAYMKIGNRDERGNHERLVGVPAEFGEAEPWMILNREEYMSLVETILVREAPRFAEAALMREMLDDTRDTRDRMLTLVEEGWTT